ncbi:hypothetical protein KR093_001679 [Drosophila rubida]|uniref:HTH psq-type domain-containing protein n=1 Tax=Drosophila rubida TaxID=30044 RepID=A0AAD4PGH9_9MUSC|nr:hypothetical protein KR093_001679 [Drosophila rubida]
MDISAYQHMNIRMSTRGKRPLRNLTPNDKVRAIQRIHNGETKASVSRDIGVPESTLRGWCKNEQKLRFMCRQLGTDNLGQLATHLDTPPEKRAKLELQLLPPKFATMPSYDELGGFGGLPFPAMDYSSHNEALLEKFALVEFLKRNGLHSEDVRATGTDPASPVTSGGYSTNNMVHQLNLLALFNSKLSSKVEPHNPAAPTAAANLNPKSADALPLNQLDEAKKYNCPLLSVKNWAKDPAKSSHVPFAQPPFSNDSNNNDIEGRISTSTPTPEIAAAPPPAPGPTQLPLPDADGQNQGALLDWCKMFSASLNFFAFAAAAASMHPGAATAGAGTALGMQAGSENEAEAETDVHGFNETLLKRLSPSVHSESSKESYYDSEPEDLSVRSCASKVSSPANSRSQSPDKNSTSSTSIHSDGEQ